MIQTLEWTDQGVRFIDQTKLPTEETYVTCKTHEQVADVIRNMVVRGAPAIGVAAAMGIALGVPAALWASRAVGSFLYGLSPTDPWTYAVLAIVLGGIALSAAWIPAQRASDVDPMVALRYE